ncbi:MAG: phosphopentomutase, partial [Alphaproteobacteria bacterium]
NDPTWPGTEHTRERVPVICHGAGRGSLGHGSMGLCAFTDVAASIAAHLNVASHGTGVSFL